MGRTKLIPAHLRKLTSAQRRYIRMYGSRQTAIQIADKIRCEAYLVKNYRQVIDWRNRQPNKETEEWEKNGYFDPDAFLKQFSIR